jgi:hypothetical protein
MTEGGDQDRKRWFRKQFEMLRDLLVAPDAPLRDRVRASLAVVSVGLSCMLFEQTADPAELHEVVLDLACELAGVSPPRNGFSPPPAEAQPVLSAPATARTRGSTR